MTEAESYNVTEDNTYLDEYWQVFIASFWATRYYQRSHAV